MVTSQQVSWWPAHEFISELTKHVKNLPSAGTPTWCALADDDPRKLLALAVAGEHHVLRVEAAQQARADASKAVSGAVDWSRLSSEIRTRAEFYTARPWLRRKGAA